MIKEEKFFKFWKLKCVNTKKKLKGIESSNMTVQALIGEHLGVFFWTLSFKNIQEFFVLRPAGWSEETSVVCWTEFWSGTSTFWVQPKGRKARVPSGNSSCFFLKKNLTQNCTSFLDQWWLFHSTLFILISKEILMNCPCSWRESVVNLCFSQQWTCSK